jgi:hypothetical protein
MKLMGTLVDSSLIRPTDYEAYLPKFILEAKQTLKKQLILEKSKAIEKKRQEEEDKKSYSVNEREDSDGNNRLSLFATLILPFWDKNPQVEPIIRQLLGSSDKRLRYNTAMLLLRNHRTVPDSLIHSFAALDEFRYELYTDLKRLKKEALFPAAFRNQQSMAQSRLIGLKSYGRPDTLIFLTKLPMQYKDWNGLVYFFKYKEKKEDNTWKIATAGLFPKDTTGLQFRPTDGEETAEEDDFTELTNTKLTTESTEAEQIKKLQKKMLYSRRKSASQFYEEENRYNHFELSRMR